MKRTLFILILITPIALAPSAAGQVGEEPPLDSRFEEDQRIEAETALGQISVGVSGLTEDVKRNATRGDLEIGTFFQKEFDAVVPRVAEIRPFIFNRIDSTYDSAYASLGLGVGTRLSLRKKHEENNWFVRLSVLTTSETYREIYGTNRESLSIAEVFAGFEFVLADVTIGRAMQQRLTGPGMIELRVPARLMEDQAIDPEVLREVHTLIISAYLARAGQLLDVTEAPQGRAGPRMPVLGLIEQATGQPMTLAQSVGLIPEPLAIPEEDLARRRDIASGFLLQGLTAMMRGDYPLLILITSPKDSPSRGRRATINTSMMSRPGMNPKPRNTPLDADTMIRDFIATYCEQMR